MAKASRAESRYGNLGPGLAISVILFGSVYQGKFYDCIQLVKGVYISG